MQTHVHRVGFAPLIPTFIADMGLTYAAAATIMAAYFWSYAVMQVPVGVLTDRLGARRVMLGCMGVMALGAVAFSLSHTYVQSLVSRCLLGMGAAATWLPGLRLIQEWFEPRSAASPPGSSRRAAAWAAPPRCCSCRSWPSISAGGWATRCSRRRCWAPWSRSGFWCEPSRARARRGRWRACPPSSSPGCGKCSRCPPSGPSTSTCSSPTAATSPCSPGCRPSW